MANESMHEKYEGICEKLGFIPSEYKYEYEGELTENDNEVSPFAILTTEEILFLYDNGYLNKK